MKYTIIAFISCITSCTFAYAGKSNLAYDSGKNDSLAFELLKLEYSYFVAETDVDKYQLLMQRINLNLKNASVKQALYDIERIEKLNPKVLIEQSFYSHIQDILFKNALYNTCIEYINKDTLNNFDKNRSFLKVLCLNEESQMNEIKDEIKKLALQFNKDTSVIFQQLKDYNIKSSEKISVLMQAFLPGSGMINEGELKEGITSFIINGVFIAAPILLLKQSLYFTGLSYGVFPFAKFYTGGIKHTQFLANENLEISLNKIKRENALLLYEFYKK